MENIHASCISLNGKGILLTGQSGSGKSDMSLRLIMEKGAVLVADDRTNICARNGKLLASCPDNIKGLLEVRGVGIVNMPFQPHVDVCLIVELVSPAVVVERLPEPEYEDLCGLKIKKIKLYPFEASAIHKIVLACGEKSEVC